MDVLELFSPETRTQLSMLHRGSTIEKLGKCFDIVDLEGRKVTF
jgi:hypothetical protein